MLIDAFFLFPAWVIRFLDDFPTGFESSLETCSRLQVGYIKLPNIKTLTFCQTPKGIAGVEALLPVSW